MYSHVCGYQFFAGVDANGYRSGHGKTIHVDLGVMPGEFDDRLKCPAKAVFTIELSNQRGGKNVSHTMELECNQPTSTEQRFLGCTEDYYLKMNDFLKHT